MKLGFTGYGATAEKAKSVMQACAEEPKVKVAETTVNGKPGTEVRVNVDAMSFTSFFSEADTLIVKQDPPLSQLGGGLLDFGSAALKGGCSVVTFGQAKGTCDALNSVSNWNSKNQAQLSNSLRVAMLEKAQEKCGPLEWEDQKKAITDSYRAQAAKQGKDPFSVKVVFVDGKGEMSKGVPDFTRSTLQKLYDKGVLNKKGDGPRVEFSKVDCTKLPGGYQAKYPDPSTEPK